MGVAILAAPVTNVSGSLIESEYLGDSLHESASMPVSMIVICCSKCTVRWRVEVEKQFL